MEAWEGTSGSSPALTQGMLCSRPCKPESNGDLDLDLALPEGEWRAKRKERLFLRVRKGEVGGLRQRITAAAGQEGLWTEDSRQCC